MSGEETDDKPIQDPTQDRQKELIRVPVRWINPQLTDMFHVIDSWKGLERQESMANGEGDLRGNKPLKRQARSKPAVVGTHKKGLPRNWYDDTWYKSIGPGKQGKLQKKSDRAIPMPVCSNLVLLWPLTKFCPQHPFVPTRGPMRL